MRFAVTDESNRRLLMHNFPCMLHVSRRPLKDSQHITQRPQLTADVSRGTACLEAQVNWQPSRPGCCSIARCMSFALHQLQSTRDQNLSLLGELLTVDLTAVCCTCARWKISGACERSTMSTKSFSSLLVSSCNVRRMTTVSYLRIALAYEQVPASRARVESAKDVRASHCEHCETTTSLRMLPGA